MRIIAGLFKGFSLASLPGQHTRPTTDRVREAWASSITSLRDEGFIDARVLDAFAGSGALGIEAFSRGAASVVFIDNEHRAVQVIRENLASLGLAGDPRIKLLQADSLSPNLPGRIANAGPFDLVILDPPYALSRERVDAVLSTLIKAKLLADGCIVSYERRAERGKIDFASISEQPKYWLAGFKMVSCKHYGSTVVEYHRFAGDAAPSDKKRGEMSSTCALVPGTYDPVTLGHINVIKRAARIFDRVVVSVAASPNKGGRGPLFSLEERVAFIRDAIADQPNVDVKPFEGLLVDFAREEGALVIVKGLRAVTDFDSEFQQASINHELSPDLDSLFIMANPEHMFLSSSMVKEIASHGGKISDWVTEAVRVALEEKFAM